MTEQSGCLSFDWLGQKVRLEAAIDCELLVGSVLAKATVRPSAVSGPPDSLSSLDLADMVGAQDQAEDKRHTFHPFLGVYVAAVLNRKTFLCNWDNNLRVCTQ